MPNAKAPFTRRCLCLAGLGLALAATGCAGNWPWAKKSPDGPADPMMFGMTQPGLDASPAITSGDLAKAHELYRKEEFAKAEPKFTVIAENKKNSAAVCEEARFYSAECLYRQKIYPGACDTYSKMLQDFPSGHYKDQAVQRMFDIANYWLKDTDVEMKEYKEKVDGKRSFVMPAGLKIHVGDSTMPTLDTEGRAIKALEVVHYADITGPLADRALFLCGYIRFFREDYPEADHYFTQLIEQHKESPLVPQAIELDIIAKSLFNGGPDYDSRKVAEARQLIDTAMKNYPELANQKKDFLIRQMFSVTAQQAMKEIHRAEFYERIGHPGSAYFIYAGVARRYRNTKYEEQALKQMERLHDAMEKEKEAEKHPNAITGTMNSIGHTWNRMWGLETPLEKQLEQEGKVDNTPPAGAAPQVSAPAKQPNPGPEK
ncbi:MAG TPA: outer membrane protein assembly factor BamD [Gemmataceae bacterium]|nr:outer membrane protein assembly factor BamD [Gemmataceae bacterium]